MEWIIKDYKTYLCTLREVSRDGEHDVSLLDDEETEHRIYNFDAITKNFCKRVRGEKNMSCDGYYEKNKDDTYLIEFKNQEEGSIDKKWIKNKIYDSISTLAMNENRCREEVARRTTVILVYNDARKAQKENGTYATSKSFNAFAEKMAQLASLSGVDAYEKKFDLVRYRGVLFQDVFTIDKTVFEKEFMRLLFDRTPRK